MKELSIIRRIAGLACFATLFLIALIGCSDSTSPTVVTVGPDGNLYVLNQGDNTLYVYETKTNTRIDSVDTQVNKPHYIEFSPDGANFYIVTLENTGAIAKFDAATNTFIQSVTAPPAVQPSAIVITPDSRYGYVCNFSAASSPTKIHKYDLTTMTHVDSLPAGVTTHDLKITSDGSVIVACNRFTDNLTLAYPGPDTVTFVNIDNDSVYAAGRAKYGPFGVAIDHRDSLAFIACMDARQIRVLDIAARMIVDSIDIPVSATLPISGPTLMAVAPDNDVVFVTTRSGNSIVAVRFSTHEVLADIPLSTQFPFGISMSSDGSRVYVATIGNPLEHGMVYIVDGDTYKMVDSLVVGKENFGLIWQP